MIASRQLTTAAVMFLVGFTALSGLGKYALGLLNHSPLVFRVFTSERLVALTFDDGPDPRFTPKILHILNRYYVPATFFVVGENALQRPDLLQAELAAGHEVENHTADPLIPME